MPLGTCLEALTALLILAELDEDADLRRRATTAAEKLRKLVVRARSDPRRPSAIAAHMVLDGHPAEFGRELIDDRVWLVLVS